MNKKVILCVDDEFIILNSLKKELQRYFSDSMTIEIAESGKEGLEAIEFLTSKRKEIVIIISDYIMPNMQGDKFLIEAHKHLPVAMKILLTGEANIEGVTNVINKTNLYRYISKPWDKNDLIMTVESAIEMYESNKQIKLQTRQIQDSIRYAENIQSAILPPQDYLDSCLPNHFIFYRPKDLVSGDFYWCKKINNKVIIAVADCTGHGVPGAFMSLIGHQLLNRTILEKKIYSPDKILENMNKVIGELWSGKQSRTQDGMEIAICVIDEKTKKVDFAGARRPICIVENNELFCVKGDKAAIDGKEGVSYTKHEFELKMDSYVYLYSDGYQDQFGGEKNKRFMSQNLKSLFLNISIKTTKEQLEEVTNTFDNWKENQEQRDDVLVVGIKI
ncbi:SpoIIE-like protein with response regulator receiver domain [Bernardetia litoralis DSM 6794]|uniref:SpoIIE-like protein with response regulator receiver domain n=1 Tax=Bernardetia litoralis (strain ATCC 23117 / DSM 6794 / NBRC 15988 / NCIMB 1366 / Fx l1 / Sio-4) TaxID=880071 RepID=I4AIK8_BERLS|nr:SpoIIE family protein phosphatase [Bernardetia litoralis]AFM03793.1 SpoIIE-like protein with response regulator receiver domain [Bernardetia litoralis DSM 6794]